MNKTPLELLDDEYSDKIRALQDESMRTGVYNDDEYENIRSSYVLQRVQLQTNHLLP